MPRGAGPKLSLQQPWKSLPKELGVTGWGSRQKGDIPRGCRSFRGRLAGSGPLATRCSCHHILLFLTAINELINLVAALTHSKSLSRVCLGLAHVQSPDCALWGPWGARGSLGTLVQQGRTGAASSLPDTLVGSAISLLCIIRGGGSQWLITAWRTLCSSKPPGPFPALLASTILSFMVRGHFSSSHPAWLSSCSSPQLSGGSFC